MPERHVAEGGEEANYVAESISRVRRSERRFCMAEVIENGVPELAEAIDPGEIPVSAAAELTEVPHEAQYECLKRRFDGEKFTAKAVKEQLQRIDNRKKRDEARVRAVREVDAEDSSQIHHCPFQKVEQVAGIAAESVQLVCTDIPYGNEFMDQIGELAAFSERVLVSGGLFVAFLGQHCFNEKGKVEMAGNFLIDDVVVPRCHRSDAPPANDS